MADDGLMLAGALGRGLSSGVKAYQNERDSIEDKAIRRKQIAAQLAIHGLREDGDGNYVRIPGGGDALGDEYKKLQIQMLKKKLASGGAEELTAGQEAADREFGKDASNYYHGGGRAGLESNFQKLQGAIDTLGAKPNLTGGLSTRIPLLGSDMAQDTLNPEMSAVRDDIRGAVQGSLREIMGPQFTEKEGTAIFNRAFNPRLSGKENVKKASSEMEKLRRMADSKDAAMSYFKAHGTLAGFDPGTTSLAKSKAPAGGGLLEKKTAKGLMNGYGAQAGGDQQTRVVDGVQYRKVPGGWQRM